MKDEMIVGAPVAAETYERQVNAQHYVEPDDGSQRLFEQSRRKLELYAHGAANPEMTIPENSAGERSGNDASRA